MKRRLKKAARRPRDAEWQSPSPFLRAIVPVGDNRRYGLRRFVLLIFLALLFAFVVTTLRRGWPASPVFDLIYAGHDRVYLPIKGTLWTAWFPWCLILWLPAAALLVYAAWVWGGGVDPVRRLQRRIALSIVVSSLEDTPYSIVRGADRLNRVARLTARFGFPANYLRSVIAHACDEALDHIEHALLASHEVSRRTLARTLAFVDADMLLNSEISRHRREAQLLKTICHLALLSHLDAVLVGPVMRRMDRLHQTLARPVGTGEEHVGQLVTMLQTPPRDVDLEHADQQIDFILQAADTASRGHGPAEGEDSRGFAEAILGRVAFSLFAQPGGNRAAVAVEALEAVEQLWTSLALAGNSDARADALAEQMRQARLPTCRHLIQRRWATAVQAVELPIWPDPAHLHWSLEGDALAAGVDAYGL